jgi:hypothetical protein
MTEYVLATMIFLQGNLVGTIQTVFPDQVSCSATLQAGHAFTSTMDALTAKSACIKRSQ